MTSRDFWQGKRIAVIGLGHNGRMVEDIKFLIKTGALVSVYDLKSEARLKTHLVFLRSIGLANYVCGAIPADDLLDMDLIILSHEYPRESSFLEGVYAANRDKEKKDIIEVEYPETMFFKQAPPVTVVGVMGESGKATVVSMLTPLLEAACGQEESQGFFVIDPESGKGILSYLKRIKNGDLVLMRIEEPMMRELSRIRISPQVAIFTTMPGKNSYEQSPFEILAYQTYNNFVIAADEVIDATRRYKDIPRAKMLRTKASIIPGEWGLQNAPAGRHSHDRDNAALALQAARLFKIDDESARRILMQWKPVKGRLEFIKKVRQVEFYNDTASQNSCSTQAALQSLSDGKHAILIFGGAHGECDYRTLYAMLPRHAHAVVLLPGSGTLRERAAIEKIEGVAVHSAPSVEEAARIAMEHAHKGDKVLFSPGFAAAGMDGSRKERGERFVRAVRLL